jgi:hypothetical protein
VIADAALPPGLPPPASTLGERAGIHFPAARWQAEELAALAAHLVGPGARALAEIGDAELLAAWSDTVDELLDPTSEPRLTLEPLLLRCTGLSPEGLSAGLAAVLGGVRRPHAERLLSRARSLHGEGLLLVVLAGNLPALAVQPLLPALALRRPTLLKSASAEPLFTPALVRGLTRRLPALAEGIAALTWPGGDRRLELPLLEAARQVVAYGDSAALADLRGRAAGEVLDYGPKLSLAVIGAEIEPAAVAAGIARDIALFDQRGCLSVQAVLTAGDPTTLAEALAAALAERATAWPPGEPAPVAAAQVHQLRAEAQMRGLWLADLPLRVGTVLLEPLPELQPSPGLRTVRIHPLPDLRQLQLMVAPWRGRLQGAALAGSDAWALAGELATLGVSRCAPPGELQSPDASWHNGGRDLLLSLGS